MTRPRGKWTRWIAAPRGAVRSLVTSRATGNRGWPRRYVTQTCRKRRRELGLKQERWSTAVNTSVAVRLRPSASERLGVTLGVRAGQQGAMGSGQESLA